MRYGNDLLSAAARRRQFWRTLPGLLVDGISVLAVATLIVSLDSLYDAPGTSAGSLVVRCDEASSAAANRAHDERGSERDWRRARRAAFQRCIEGSRRDSSETRPQGLTRLN